jgi:hypothetical protein
MPRRFLDDSGETDRANQLTRVPLQGALAGGISEPRAVGAGHWTWTTPL